MIAVDTNIVVRLLADDDPEQSRRARQLFAQEDIWIGSTVLLETAWVLDAVYGRGNQEIVDALRAVLGLPNVSTEAPAAMARALDASAAGIDLADAIHVCSASAEAEAFVTFDRTLRRRAGKLRPIRLA